MTQPNDASRKSPRTFQCRDQLWETFEQMARELECSIDYLINEAMKQYARQRSYGPQTQAGNTRTPFPGARDTGLDQPPPQQPQRAPLPPTAPAAPMPMARPPTSAPTPPPPMPSAPGRLPPPPPAGGGRLPPPPPVTGRQPPVAAPAPPPAVSRPPVGGPPPLPRGSMPPPMPQHHAPPPPPPSHHMPAHMPPQQHMAPPPPPPPQQHVAPQQHMPPMQQHMAVPQQPQGVYLGALTAIYQGERTSVNKEKFIIGRGRQTSDLTIKDPNVSRQHAMVEFQNGVYYMVDLGSTNGVEYQGQRVTRKAIAEGDTFRICDHDVVFTYR